MELWIRSQDREQLRKIVDIKYQKGTLEDEDIEVIIGTIQYDEWEVLGQYKTKERALEVLDEIQKLLMPTIEYNPVVKKEESWEEEYQRTILKGYDVKIEQSITYVYEMPID